MTPVLPQSDDFVALTVWLTFIIGVAFIIMGIYGRQRWLQFWGITTLIACGAYFIWPLLR